MTADYQAENWIPFSYPYLDDDNEPIDVSTALSVMLYLYFPTSLTPKTVVGTYSPGGDSNVVVATAKTIVNSDLSSRAIDHSIEVGWQFKVVLTAGSEPIWSPRQTLPMWQNFG